MNRQRHHSIGTVFRSTITLLLIAVFFAAARAPRATALELLNVSYDPTRELWRDLNAAFVAQYTAAGHAPVMIRQSHGGSSAQARAVIDGLDADVVTLALWPDVDAIRQAGLIAASWEERLPNHAVAFTSTIVFVVRKGNPKHITDWPDLVQPGIQIVTPSPKTSGNGKLSLLAAWGSVTQRGGSVERARDYITKLYRQAPVLDSGARGSAATFAQKQIGDVHLTWENEAYPEVAEAGGGLEIVYPPISILAQPPLAVVDETVRRKGTRELAEAYLRFVYTPEGQEIIARHYCRPVDADVLRKHAAAFPDIARFPVTAIATDWKDANATFFADGGVFDAIHQPAN